MFIALFFSYAFSLGYAYVAARSRRWRRVLIPALDILQSVPVLGFLAITVTFFVALFPGSELGFECAAIFAVFTSQAWNITFSFYHSLISQPAEFDEASKLMGLSQVEAVLDRRRAGRRDRPGLERDDELRRQLVLPDRL